MGLYLMDPKCRQAFANEPIARVVLNIMDFKYSVSSCCSSVVVVAADVALVGLSIYMHYT